MYSTQIWFKDRADTCMLRSDSPEVVRQVRQHPAVAVMEFDGKTIRAQVPLQLLAQGYLFPQHRDLRRMAQGGGGMIHISH